MNTINKPPIEIIFHSSIRRGASVSSVSWLSGLLSSLFSVGDSDDNDDDNDDDGDDDIVMSVCWDIVTDGAIVLSFCTPCNSVVKTEIQWRKTQACQTEQLIMEKCHMKLTVSLLTDITPFFSFKQIKDKTYRTIWHAKLKKM